MTYEDLEDKIIARVKDQVRKLKSVEAYAGQLEQEIEQLAVQVPAAFVVHLGSKFKWVDGSTYMESPEVGVLLVQRVSPSTGKASRAVLESTTEALTHQTLGLDMERLMPVHQELVFTNTRIEVRSIRFQCSFDRDFS